MYTITAKCSCCGRVEDYDLDEKEYETLIMYQRYGRQMGYIPLYLMQDQE